MKNNSIALWRIIFTYLVMIFHFDNKYLIFQELQLHSAWYIGVEFFFIVSGYLLYQNRDKLSRKCQSGWGYFVYRYKKIYPYYLGAFLFSFVCYVVVNRLFSVKSILKLACNSYFEALALHGIGLDIGWAYLNNTSWFISIMLISGLIIFHCLLKWKDTFCNLVAPCIILISFSYLYRNMQGIGAVVQISGLYNNMALMRGLADMCLGIFAARLTNHISAHYKVTRWLRAIGVGGFLFVILFSTVYAYSTIDFLYALILTVSVGIAFLPSEGRLCSSRFLQSWSGVTLSMYLLHDAFRTFIFPVCLGYTDSLSRKLIYLLSYLVVVTICAALYDKMIRKFCTLGRHWLNKCKK